MTRLDPTPAVNSAYGAPMGRASDHLPSLIVTERDTPFMLQHIPLDSGGYDRGGAYWGHGPRLYWWSITIREDGCADLCSGYFRAADRDAAKAFIRQMHPAARFYR